MNSYVSWVGGKKALRDLIVELFPLRYSRYIEVFGGAGWVLFHKLPGRDFEVYNDFNSLLVNMFRVVRCKRKARRMKELMEYSLNSREDFELIRHIMNSGVRLPDFRRAAYYYQQIRYSYSSGLNSFASQPHDIRGDFPLIDMALDRLRNVVVEHQDCEQLIRHYDRADSFFYCDPPYHTSEHFYQNVGEFTIADHWRLHDALLSIRGKFLLSYNDDPFVRDLYRHEGLYFYETKRLHNMRQRVEGGALFPELLIANYDIHDPSQLASAQTSLF